MFHVMLVLPALILLVIIMSIILFGLLAFIASLVGGASVAYLVKNKSAKRLLFVGFSILSFIGLLPMLPVIMAVMSVSLSYITAVIVMMLICIGILSITGIIFSRALNNKYGKILLAVIFCIILVSAIFFAILAPIISSLLLSSY